KVAPAPERAGGSETDVRPDVAERAQHELNHQRLIEDRRIQNDGAARIDLIDGRLADIGRILEAERRTLVLVAEPDRVADGIEDRRRLSQRVIVMARHIEHEGSVDRPPILESVAETAGQALARELESKRGLGGVEGVVDAPVYAGEGRLGDSVEALELKRRTVELLLAHERDRGRERLQRLAEHE